MCDLCCQSADKISYDDLLRARKALRPPRYFPKFVPRFATFDPSEDFFSDSLFQREFNKRKEVRNKMANTYKAYKLTDDRDELDCSIMSSYDDLIERGYEPVFGFEFDEDDDYTDSYRLYKSYSDFLQNNSCDSCSCCIDSDMIDEEFEAIESNMFSNSLTTEQKARMSKEDQAFSRLGWIDSSLRFTQEGKSAYVAMKMAEDFKVFAKHAQSEVDRMEAEKEARRNS